MESDKVINFQSLKDSVGRFNLREKTFLIPEMNRIGAHLLAATFRGFGIHAKVMDTCKGLDLGQEYTSGKECYPCQITTGDILYYMQKERERLGDDFNPENYVYFMPEADGPCRFGMYNKYQRIVLDSFGDLGRLKIGSLTTEDGYSLAGIIEKERVRDLRKAAYFSVVVADILDRLLWKIRPYEKEPGMTDEFIEKSMHVMEDTFKTYGSDKQFEKILDKLEDIIEEGKTIIDPGIPPKPRIGIVGEIYLRTHVHANQDVIKVLEKYGAEVVNASISEWVNYTTYDGLRDAKIGFRLNLKQFRFGPAREHLKKMLGFGVELLYQQRRQKQVYKRVRSLIDLQEDHKVGHLEDIIKKEDLFSFDVGTEACLSIPGIVQYARDEFNGVVNVYPFTCMPSTITSAIVKPLMNELGIPYLDTPYDSSTQPGREASIRTFMYQAHQHFKRKGGRK
ncbi:MAG: CoA activase [Deltaproteobacteria bacterium]|nr:CoA activase [Deltaproteobacteria bacterium]MBW2116835.1 CoA activase [Deltaproteobacteria bacterium]MBW2342861.1 CoA activase [Deltaproteobacteria bacterium]